jgi:pimeloyl-ACP methyl ester carboxylesterase
VRVWDAGSAGHTGSDGGEATVGKAYAQLGAGNAGHTGHTGSDGGAATVGEAYAQLGHGRVRYLHGGLGAGRPVVVFLHGVSAVACMWTAHMAALQGGGYGVLAVDFYGHGLSACPRGVGFAPALFAAQLAELLDALGLGRVALVGHSMGGLVALAVAAAHPARVSHLALLNAVGLPAPPGPWAPATLAARYFRGVYQGMRAAGLRHLAAAAGAWLLDRLARAVPVDRRAVRRRMALQAEPTHGAPARVLRSLRLLVDLWSWQQALCPRGGVFESFLRSWNPFADYSATVARAGATPRPVLLLWGAKDPLVPAAAMARFAALLPGAVAKAHPACDHNLPLQRPAYVVNELLHFLASHNSGSKR